MDHFPIKNPHGNAPDEHTKGGRLGTFAGVFTPSILTILGIILFLRLGYVVGSAGLGRALLIIGLANAISILTSLSLAAIATNLKVRGGGDYYLISRTLGVEFGGSIGLVLFLAQSVSVAFYCIGFAEAVTSITPDNVWLSSRIVALGAVFFLFIFAWLGADWATRLQYLIMAVLALALLSFFVGGLERWSGDLFLKNWHAPPAGTPFWVLFAIFFPAVTGFTQGVSMSGDLKDPGRSLPKGTFLAVAVSIIVYLAVAMLFAGTVPGEVLIQDYGAMRQTAVVGMLIDAGVIGATISSAMASFLGAPRILQSLAHDRIFKMLVPFAKGSGPSNNPRRGVLLTFGIALCTVSLGELNLIAPLVSMFFLISYGLLNYATFFEARAASPSFRPRFRWFDQRLSLLGSLTCLGAMLAIDLTAGSLAVAVLFAIYQYLKRTAGPARWADSTRSYHLQQLREHLLAASEYPEHPRDWRPQLLALSNDTSRRAPLLRFGSWMQGGSGIITAVQILEGHGASMLKAREDAEAELKGDIAQSGVHAFPLVLVAPSLEVGIQGMVQAYGVGPLKANTMVLNWLGKVPERIFAWQEEDYRQQLRTAFRLGCNIILLDAKENLWDGLEKIPGEDRRIDVWWSDDRTGHLLLLLAYLLTRSSEWKNATIKVIGSGGEHDTNGEESLRRMLEDVRIDAQPTVVPQNVPEVIAEHSADATMVFLPFRIGKDELEGPFSSSLQHILTHLPITALVLAAEDIDLDAAPEEGKAAEAAAVLDAMEDARRKAKDAVKDAMKAIAEVEKSREALEENLSAQRDSEILEKLKENIMESEAHAEKMKRRAEKAKAKAEDAEKEANTFGLMAEDDQDE